MNIFHTLYSKPGPGVKKQGPQKNNILRFMTLCFRKITDLIKLNLLFSLFAFFCVAIYFVLSMFFSNLAVFYLPVIMISPFVGGLTLVTRNFVNEKHAFIFSDFWDATKQNWKAFLLNGFIVYLFLMIFSVSLPYYWNAGQNDLIAKIAFYICTAMAFYILFAQFYIPLMIVTFKMKYSQIFRNALIFALVGLWRNLLLLVLLSVNALLLYYLAWNTATLALLFILLLLITFSFISFLINFIIYPIIDLHMIQPLKSKEKSNDEDENDRDFKD